MFQRNIAPSLLEALKDSPVVLVNGARQTGKSTLVQMLATEGPPTRYLTLDDPTLFAAANDDPSTFVSGLRGRVIIDEVQRAPGLFRAIKAEVDRERTPGRFLLTGSADVLLLPRLSESLAGRMDVHTLWPLSQGEIENGRDGFVEAVFSADWPPKIERGMDRGELLKRVVRGGFPEPLQRTSASRRGAWFTSYLATLLSRDVRELANIEGLTVLPRLMALLAARTSSLANFAEISRSTGLNQSTLKRYISLLETLFLLQPLPAWSINLGKRMVRAPKLHLVDSGIAAHLVGADEETRLSTSEMIGPLLENFVVMELRKQSTWSTTRITMHHFRTHSGEEVDVVLEDAAGRCVGIEVKSASSASIRDAKGLRALSEAIGDKFVRGIVLHTGPEHAALGPDIWALPISALWTTRA